MLYSRDTDMRNTISTHSLQIDAMHCIFSVNISFNRKIISNVCFRYVQMLLITHRHKINSWRGPLVLNTE